MDTTRRGVESSLGAIKVGLIPESAKGLRDKTWGPTFVNVLEKAAATKKNAALSTAITATGMSCEDDCTFLRDS